MGVRIPSCGPHFDVLTAQRSISLYSRTSTIATLPQPFYRPESVAWSTWHALKYVVRGGDSYLDTPSYNMRSLRCNFEGIISVSAGQAQGSGFVNVSDTRLWSASSSLGYSTPELSTSTGDGSILGPPIIQALAERVC